MKIIFSYNGYANAFNVINEVKVYTPMLTIKTHRLAFVDTVQNPVKTMRTNAFVSLLVVAILYQLANIAYFAAGRFCAHLEIAVVKADFGPTVSKTELQQSTQIAASLFFQKVFGSSGAVRGLNFLIALSAFGNLIAVLLGQSRMIRECGRYFVHPLSPAESKV